MDLRTQQQSLSSAVSPVALSATNRKNTRLPRSSLNFLLLPHNFTTNQGLHSKFSHPTPRTAYQCTYAKEMR